MASSTFGYPSPQQGPVRRPPKLSYRTKSGDAESLNTMSTESTNPTSPLRSNFCPSPRFPPSIASESSAASSSRSTNPSTTSLAARTANCASKQKKKGFFSGLFDVKEPSAQALADYQKQLLKQGNRRVTAVGLPGVSSAKLPPTVPKTNSKWDGVPQTVKEREKSKRYSSKGLHRTISSAESSSSDTGLTSSRKRESRSGALTHSSGSSRNNLADLYGWEIGSQSSGSIKEKDFAKEIRPSTSGTTFSHNAPPSGRDSSFPPHNSPHAPKIVRTGTDAPPSSKSGALSPPGHSYSPSLTPLDLSPVTPDAPRPPAGHASSQTEANADDYFKTTVLEAPAFGEVIVRSAGVNILGPPATAKRRPKLAPDYYDEASGKIETLNLQLNPILKKEKAPSKETMSPCLKPVGDKSFTPARSTLSRKGLGLAMNLKNQATAPSLAPRETIEASDEERINTPTPESGQSIRKKSQMTLFSN